MLRASSTNHDAGGSLVLAADPVIPSFSSRGTLEALVRGVEQARETDPIVRAMLDRITLDGCPAQLLSAGRVAGCDAELAPRHGCAEGVVNGPRPAPGPQTGNSSWVKLGVVWCPSRWREWAAFVLRLTGNAWQRMRRMFASKREGPHAMTWPPARHSNTSVLMDGPRVLGRVWLGKYGGWRALVWPQRAELEKRGGR